MRNQDESKTRQDTSIGPSQDEVRRRVTDCEVQGAVHATKIRSLEDKIATLVSATEFLPVKLAVYGIVGTALLTVLSALIAGVIGVAPHVAGR